VSFNTLAQALHYKSKNLQPNAQRIILKSPPRQLLAPDNLMRLKIQKNTSTPMILQVLSQMPHLTELEILDPLVDPSNII
jgi:hypothetical protein